MQLVARVIAVQLGCSLCGQNAVLETSHTDRFTQEILRPAQSFVNSHRAPRQMSVLLAAGPFQQWVPC